MYKNKDAKYYAENREAVLARARERERLLDPEVKAVRRTKKYAKDRQRAIERAKAYQLAHPDKARASTAKYSALNPHKAVEWRAANNTLVRLYCHARRLLSRGNSTYTKDDILDLMHEQRCRCKACGVDFTNASYEIDHIMPLSLGGSNDPANLQLLCGPCNRSKSNIHPDIWKLKVLGIVS